MSPNRRVAEMSRSLIHRATDRMKIVAYRTEVFPNEHQIRSPLKRIELAAALRTFDIDRQAVMLDLCCGSGLPGQLIAKRCSRVIGLDKDQKQVTDAAWHRRHSRVGSRIDLVRADAQAIPLGDGTVDVCISLCAIEHLQDAKRACDEVFRVLRSGGTFVITADSLEDVPSGFPVARHASLYDVVRYYSAAALEDLLSSAGFAVQRCTPILRSSLAADELERSMSSQRERGWISSSVIRRRMDSAEHAQNGLAGGGLFVLGVATKPAPSEAGRRAG